MSSNGTQTVYRIASIPGDGIGPEVISAGITVLEKLASVLGTFDLYFDHFAWSSDYYKKHGRYIPEGGLEDLKRYDAIFFGAVGAPGMPFPPQLPDRSVVYNSTVDVFLHRRPRPYFPLVSPPRARPTPPTLRQRPPHPRPPRHHTPPNIHRRLALQPRLGNHPREHRRGICRPRRPHAYRTAVGGGY